MALSLAGCSSGNGQDVEDGADEADHGVAFEEDDDHVNAAAAAAVRDVTVP